MAQSVLNRCMWNTFKGSLFGFEKIMIYNCLVLQPCGYYRHLVTLKYALVASNSIVKLSYRCYNSLRRMGTSFGRSDYWDHLGAQTLVMIGR